MRSANYLAKLERAGYFIPIISGEMFSDLKQSNTGGATEMYVPTNLNSTSEEDETVFCYDVNSLYP